jgi:hypothetical protein
VRLHERLARPAGGRTPKRPSAELLGPVLGAWGL